MSWLRWLAIGAGLMFLLDPDSGRRRRARLRDKGATYSRIAREEAGGRSRDLSNRVFGLWAELQKALPAPLTDELRHRREAREPRAMGRQEAQVIGR